jgi:Cytochrome c7 and related cytochrome c
MKAARIVTGVVLCAAAATGGLAGWATAAPGAGRAAAPPSDAGAPDGLRRPVAAHEAVPPSPLIFPAQQIPLRFDHARHLKLGAHCETCHVAAVTSTSASDDLIPAEAACRSCHEIDRAQPAKVVRAGSPAARCDACHVSLGGVGWMPSAAAPEPPRVRLVDPNLKFNHGLHVGRGMACELCHGAVSMEGLATRADLPKMGLCLGCHDGKPTTNRCGACHLTEPDGRLRTNLASAATAATGLPEGTGKLVPSGVLRGFDAHGPSFARDHAQAGRDEGYCLSCHKRSECVDCHGGTIRPFDIHPSDYVSLHGSDARRNTPDCSSCHRAQSFCVGCHQRAGVAPDATGGLPGVQAHNPFGTGTALKTFHPPGWVNAGGGSSGHAQQARRNIRTCVSCHREESCLACHSADPTRGMGVSPHGPGFAGTSRCRALSSRNRRACVKCHALGAPEIDCEMP